MVLKKELMPVFITNIIALVIFTVVFLTKQNYEFMIYIAVIILLMFAVFSTYGKVRYPKSLLWGLTIWSILHMSGGGIYVNGEKLYELMLIPLVGAPYHIFKFDQLVHIFGFAVATLLMFILIKPLLKKDLKKWTALSIVIVMAGLGAGALNEIIEFFATVVIPNTGVGGYENTALDLVSNLIGALIAITYILLKERKQ